MKKYRTRSTYHKLKSQKEVSDCSENVAIMSNPNVKVVQVKVKPKVGLKMRLLSINLMKRFRDAYVQGMLGLAAHVVHLNNGEICFLKKIHQDDLMAIRT